MTSASVSKREAEVIDAVNSHGLLIFGPQTITQFLGISSRNAYRILTNMEEKGLITRISRGEYVLKETYESRDTYELVSALEPASYVGFWSALYFHGLTEQVPQTIFVAVTKQKRSRQIQGQQINFVRMNPDLFFGYDEFSGVVASDPEKTLLDCLHRQEYAGGIQHIYDAIPNDIDADRLIRHAERFGNGAVAARVGYLLDRKGLLENEDRLHSLVRSYTPLDQSGPRTNPVSKWKLYANVTLDD